MIRTAPLLAAAIALCGVTVLGPPVICVRAQPPPLRADPSPVGSLAEITGLQLRKDDGQLNLAFLLTQPVPIEVVGNLPKRVLVLKFSKTRTAFPDGRDQFVFNDPMVVGVAFEAIDETTTWAKVRLRTPDLLYQLQQDTANNRALLALKISPVPVGVELTGVRVATPRKESSQAVLDFTRVPQMEARVAGSSYLVRLKHVTARVPGELRGEDERIRLVGLRREGSDTLLTFELKRPVRVSSLALGNPPRLVFNFRDTGEDVTQGPPGRPAAPAPVAESLEALLAAEPDPLVRANYEAAEHAYEAGNFARAEQLFGAVYAAAPRRRLGIRAGIRMADSRFEVLKAAGATSYHTLIAQYQSAIRAAEEAKYESALIPRAFFQIGRSYQQMGFNFESNTYLQILLDRFPGARPYAADAHYYMGENLLTLRRPEAAIGAFRKFLEQRGDPKLEGPAHYWLGDALYSLKDNVAAKHEFDQARRLDPDYPAQHPLLLFHMGESYYENADFETARIAYRQLLEKYPDRAYSKLVGLRLGDFLRDEGKEQEALQVYRQVAEGAPQAIELRAKLRIADLLGSRPVGEDWKQAVTLYDEALGSPFLGAIGPETQLRKALTLTLHGRRRDAIAAFEALAQKYPDSSLVRDNIVKANIEENLRGEIDRMFQERKYWDIVRFYTQHRDQYFRKFPFPLTLFQVARAYHFLGLYDQAIGLYEDLQKGNPGTLRTLVDWQRAQALADKDDLGGAETALLQFINDHKEDVYSTDVRLRLGEVYTDGRRYQDAQTAFRILIRDFEQRKTPELIEAAPEIYYRLGLLNKDLGQVGDALANFRLAVATFNHPLQGDGVPDYMVRAQFYTADLMYELGQNQEAIATYEQAIARYPAHERAPWARYQIGLIYRRLGQDQRALETFNALLDLAKTRPGELWEPLAQENQRDLANKLQFQNYLRQ
jgi:TolA-binding protein